MKYMELTEASLVVPEVIWREIGENYISQAKQKCLAVHKALQIYSSHRGFQYHSQDKIRIHHAPLKVDPNLVPIEEDWDSIRDAYLAWLMKQLRISPRNIIPIKSIWFERLIERSVKHQKPFGEDSDKGFKDSLAWLSILDLATRPGYKNHPIVLISNNTKDFGDPQQPGKAHPSLCDEAKKHGLLVEYFDSIDKFLSSWPADVLRINQDSLRKKLTAEYIRDILYDRASNEVLRSYGQSITRSQLQVSYFNYFLNGDGKAKLLQISCSGFIDLGKSWMNLLEFSANITVEVDQSNNLSVPINSEILFKNSQAMGWGP